jgi:hypothetical protein
MCICGFCFLILIKRLLGKGKGMGWNGMEKGGFLEIGWKMRGCGSDGWMG